MPAVALLSAYETRSSAALLSLGEHGVRTLEGLRDLVALADEARAAFGAEVESRVVREEHVSFPLPRELRVLSNS